MSIATFRLSVSRELLIAAVTLGASTSGVLAQEQSKIVAVGFDAAGTKYVLDEFSFSEFGCGAGLHLSSMLNSGGANLSFQLNNDDTNETQLLAPQGQADTYHGIDVMTYVIDPFPYNLAPSPLKLIAPVDDRFAISLDETGLCSNYGFEARLIWVLVDPTLSRDFEAWLTRKHYQADMEPAATGYANLWRISVPAGKEVAALNEIKAEPWFIDEKRYSIPAGPDYVYVDFSANDVFGGSPTQNAARKALAQAVENIFGDSVKADDFVPKEGTQFKWDFTAPASVALPGDNRFDGYWLRAVVRFTFSDQGEGRWRLQIDTTDGYLPWWNRSGAPPGGVVADAHLSGEGDDTTNFASLITFQDQLITRLADVWNGEAHTLE